MSSLRASQVEKLFGTVRLDPATGNDDAYMLLVNRAGGAEGILEHMCAGRFVSEIAMHIGVPIKWFSNWVSANIDAKGMELARQLGAESLMVKSSMVLSSEPGNAQEASQARALANLYADLAAKADPNRFGNKPPDSLGNNNVQITMNIGGGPQEIVAATVDHVAAETGEIDPFTLDVTPQPDPLQMDGVQTPEEFL